MWILILIIFAGPFEVSRIETLEVLWQDHQKCRERLDDAVLSGLPPHTTAACVYTGDIRSVER